MVVQWKLPATVSTFVQRAGRVARGEGRTGTAVLLVEKSVYEADITKAPQPEGSVAKKKSKGIRQSEKYPKATKEYALQHGSNRGGYNTSGDQTGNGQPVLLDRHAKDEGLYAFVQSGTCRRCILTEIYGNEISRGLTIQSRCETRS